MFAVLQEWRASLVRCESGQALVEFALTFSILFGFIIGLMQVSLALYSYEYISEIAREGTRYAIVHGPNCMTSGGVPCEVTDTAGAGSFPSVDSYVSGTELPNMGGGTVTVNTSYPNGELENKPVQVTVTYAFPYQIPFFPSKTLSLSSTSVMYIVQ